MARKWNQDDDGAWRSDDGIEIEGSAGHWFPTRGASSLIESETIEGATAEADRHWPHAGDTSEN